MNAEGRPKAALENAHHDGTRVPAETQGFALAREVADRLRDPWHPIVVAVRHANLRAALELRRRAVQ